LLGDLSGPCLTCVVVLVGVAALLSGAARLLVSGCAWWASAACGAGLAVGAVVLGPWHRVLASQSVDGLSPPGPGGRGLDPAGQLSAWSATTRRGVVTPM
jgi:hypothetical protein